MSRIPSFASIPLPVLSRAPRLAEPPRPITPEEESGLLDRTIGWLQYAGEMLDKPGSAVRGTVSGLAGGRWGGGLLNLIPFSDAMGLTDPSERVYGRELLQMAGAPKNKPGLFNSWEDFLWDVAGFGTEVVADPLLPLTGPGKALTKAGLLASKGGKLAPGIVEQMAATIAKKPGGVRILGTSPAAMAAEIRAGERGLLGYKLPFAKEPLFTLGAGSEKAARALEKFTYNPAVGSLRYLWSKSVGGVRGSQAQQVADVTFSEMKNLVGAAHNILPRMDSMTDELAAKFSEIGQHFVTTGNAEGADVFGRFQRIVAEKGPQATATGRMAADEIADLFRAGPDGAPLEAVRAFSRDYHKAFDQFSDVKDMLYERVRELGGQAELLKGAYVNQWPRRPGTRGPAEGWDKITKARLFQPHNPFAQARSDELRWMSTDAINQLTRDELVTAIRTRSRIPATGLVEKKTYGKQAFSLNDVVRTLDRDNIGRIVQLGKARIKVQWRNPETGAIAVKQMPPSLVQPISGTVPEHLVPPAYTPYVSTADLKGSLRESLARLGVETAEDTPLDQLGSNYIWEAYWKPDIELHAGKLKSAGETPASINWRIRQGGKQSLEVVDNETPEALEGLRLGTHVPRDQVDEFTQFDWKLIENPETKIAELVRDTGEPSLDMLRKYVGGLPEGVLDTGLFDRSLLDDLGDYIEHQARVIANLESAHGFLRNVVAHTSQDSAAKQARGAEDLIPLQQAWEAVVSKNGNRLLTDRGLEKLAREIGGEGASAADMRVPPEAVRVLNTYMELADPKQTGPFAELYDTYTRAVKTGWTVPWPAFHIRNLVDGTWRNAAAGVGYNLAELGKSYASLLKHWISGKPMEFADELIDLDIGRKFSAPYSPAEGIAGGVIPFTEGGRIFGVPGTTPIRDVWRGWSKAGTKAYELVEALNRGAPYIALRRKGFDAAHAKHLVDRIQYVYDLTGPGFRVNYGAQRVARRLVPFWGFVSNNIPYQLSQLFNAPGGAHAQTIRFINAMRRESGGYMPDWMRERGAVRIAGDERNALFVRQFGLSIEELPFVFGQTPGGGTKRTAQRMLSQAHPAITTPYKLMAGQDPYTGRPLKNLNPVTGIPWLDTVLMGTPPSRAIRTIQEAAYLFPGGKKKHPAAVATDLMTGVKVGAYDLARQRLFELRELQQEDMARKPYTREFTRVYVPKDVREKLSPEQQLEADRQQEIQQYLHGEIRAMMEELEKAKAAEIGA